MIKIISLLSIIIFISSISFAGEVEKLFREGVDSLTNKDLPKALEIFDKVANMRGTPEVDKWYLYERGVIDNINFLNALSAYEKAVSENYKDSDMHYYLGRVYKFKASFTPLSKVITKEGEIVKGKEDRYVANQKSIFELQQALDLKPDRKDAILYLYEIYYQQEGLPEATSLLENAILKYPEDIIFRKAIVNIYCATGKLEEAAKNYEFIIARTPDTEESTIKEKYEFELRKVKLLMSLINSNTTTDIKLRQAPFDGIWETKADEIINFKGPSKKPEDAEKMRLAYANPILGIIEIRQKGNTLSAYTEQGETYSGLCYGKWFVLGKPVIYKLADGLIYMYELMYGELKLDNSLDGSRLIQQEVKRFPEEINFIVEKHLTARFKGERASKF
ncbi:MAG: hypothetical protein WBI28_06105 [Candidatus Omnitrophota bacterium]